MDTCLGRSTRFSTTRFSQTKFRVRNTKVVNSTRRRIKFIKNALIQEVQVEAPLQQTQTRVGNTTGRVINNFAAIFGTIQHSPPLRFLAHRQVRNPLSVILFFTLVITSIVQLIKRHYWQKVLSCEQCRGYGVQRCDLCAGKGFVGWEGKFSHLEPCPLCMGKRFNSCQICGGMAHKPLFAHTKSQTLDYIEKMKKKSQEQSAMASIMDSIGD
eukprot:TRINITY_DN11980_c0_g1_i1.p4 TRINITY_DN11980_c0_g1~~TRINITY_DN11980_c0_g1_i1.p4  ORF type:complete len:213 (-),score=5.01 TRINITY_DN11980_c0_g1_i1:1460-2098(-)